MAITVLDAPDTARLQPTAAGMADHRDFCQPCYRIGWAVAVTHPQSEAWANSNLTQRGYRCFLPLTHSLRRDRVVPTLRHRVAVPLFPGYLFVHYDNRDPWRPIHEAPGVRKLLHTGHDVQITKPGAVEAVQSALQAGEAVSAPAHAWKPGTPCSLSCGPLAGMPAVVLQAEAEAALISVMFLGYLREITVPIEHLHARREID